MSVPAQLVLAVRALMAKRSLPVGQLHLLIFSSSYGMRLSRWLMRLNRARFFSSERTTYHGRRLPDLPSHHRFRRESACLFLFADLEPVFEQDDTGSSTLPNSSQQSGRQSRPYGLAGLSLWGLARTDTHCGCGSDQARRAFSADPPPPRPKKPRSHVGLASGASAGSWEAPARQS